MGESTAAVVGPPSVLLRLLESRAVFEFGAYAAASPWLRHIGRGDHHPVLVLPGFTGDDRSTRSLRATVAANGYRAHGWGLGTNFGPSDRVLEGMHERIEELHERHRRKVSLVGWSLGGVYARELAREHPDLVRQVITLGSPFRLRRTDRSSVSWLTDRLSSNFRDEVLRLALAEADKPSLPIPSTAVYSRTDGVVRWHSCIDTDSTQHENVEVYSSHSGLGWNPSALFVVLDRLAQREGDWKPFHAPLPLRGWYPRPASWHAVA
jgi:pimeloyl-ACP methyl ester carboxylesterase